MLTPNKFDAMLEKLNLVSNDMANTVETIRTGMTGKGVNPAQSPMIELRLLEIERKLRMLGGNKDNPIPFNV